VRHPDLEKIALAVTDPDSGELDEEFHEHLARCERCRRHAGELARLGEEASLALESEDLSRVESRARQLVNQSAEIESMTARLIEDTSALADVRSAIVDGRILVFEAGECQIHLQVQRAEDERRVRLLGQVFAPPATRPATLTVRVLDGERILATVETDELGQFEIEAKKCRRFVLDVRGSRVQVRTPPIYE
jgi:hypothetical protein